MNEEPLEITVIPFEFPSERAALAAFEDLDRWIRRGPRELSAYRVAAGDGKHRIVVAVVETASGHVRPVVGRFRRAGGTFRDIPEPDKRALIERTINASAQGLDARRSYEIALPLRGMSSDPGLN